ncbi:heme ABC transporter ATP-binding protein, partial [Vibrio astriarenae]
VFSNPELLDQANLTTTSLYELAIELGIEDTNGFMQHFIDAEKTNRAKTTLPIKGVENENIENVVA